jgi:hypothetical protein
VGDNEREAFDEIEEEGVWVLLEGGGVENVSSLRSGSNGELDGEGEGEWTFMGNVKARGVGEITFSIRVLGSGSATATSRECTRESRVRMAGMMMIIIGTREEEGTIEEWVVCECDLEMIKGKDLRQAVNRLTILPLNVVTAGGRIGWLLKGARGDHVVGLLSCWDERKNN